MTRDEIELGLFAANLVIGLLIAGICMCRLNWMDRNILLWVRAKYTVLLSGSMTLACLPVLFDVHHVQLTLITLTLALILLLLEKKYWVNGVAPIHFQKRRRDPAA